MPVATWEVTCQRSLSNPIGKCKKALDGKAYQQNMLLDLLDKRLNWVKKVLPSNKISAISCTFEAFLGCLRTVVGNACYGAIAKRIFSRRVRQDIRVGADVIQGLVEDDKEEDVLDNVEGKGGGRNNQVTVLYEGDEHLTKLVHGQ